MEFTIYKILYKEFTFCVLAALFSSPSLSPTYNTQTHVSFYTEKGVTFSPLCCKWHAVIPVIISSLCSGPLLAAASSARTDLLMHLRELRVVNNQVLPLPDTPENTRDKNTDSRRAASPAAGRQLCLCPVLKKTLEAAAANLLRGGSTWTKSELGEDKQLYLEMERTCKLDWCGESLCESWILNRKTVSTWRALREFTHPPSPNSPLKKPHLNSIRSRFKFESAPNC